ncbi:hypothetical protein QAD02_020679 [Eretmocerus hayati]|uniref:Uncharacterized protein n=1 Tax=Eretmocerus hayati TaxID=131215 RepID=A0ACC2PPD9_9HYME|nr:hypothetical protein QAD02_020679 [Eretmocerus hayati]
MRRDDLQPDAGLTHRIESLQFITLLRNWMVTASGYSTSQRPPVFPKNLDIDTPHTDIRTFLQCSVLVWLEKRKYALWPRRQTSISNFLAPFCALQSSSRCGSGSQGSCQSDENYPTRYPTKYPAQFEAFGSQTCLFIVSSLHNGG